MAGFKKNEREKPAVGHEIFITRHGRIIAGLLH